MTEPNFVLLQSQSQLSAEFYARSAKRPLSKRRRGCCPVCSQKWLMLGMVVYRPLNCPATVNLQRANWRSP